MTECIQQLRKTSGLTQADLGKKKFLSLIHRWALMKLKIFTRRQMY